MYTFADWYKTAWDKINVDTLVEETKKLAKEVKTLNKAVSVPTACAMRVCALASPCHSMRMPACNAVLHPGTPTSSSPVPLRECCLPQSSCAHFMVAGAQL